MIIKVGSQDLQAKDVQSKDFKESIDALYIPRVSDEDLFFYRDKDRVILTETPGVAGTKHVIDIEELQNRKGARWRSYCLGKTSTLTCQVHFISADRILFAPGALFFSVAYKPPH